MTFGAVPPQRPNEPPKAQQLSVLWRIERRKQFRAQIITAAIYSHPAVQELRVFLEPEEAGNLLHSELARFDFTRSRRRRQSLREGAA